MRDRSFIARHSDHAFWIAIFALVATGLVMVYSSSFILAAERFKDGLYFFRRHFAYCVFGAFSFWLGRHLSNQRLIQIAKPLLIGTTIVLLLTLLPGVSHRVGGASRWINVFGFTFQPGELAKLAVVLFVAVQLQKKLSFQENWKTGFLTYFVGALPIYFALLLQPDFGTFVLLVTTTMFMLWGSGVRLRYLLGATAAMIPLATALVLAKPYRKARLLAYLDPWSDPAHKGFQIIQSFVAFYEGGLFGVGIGNSREKLFYLPEAHNDFIFSVIGEELGLLGVVFVIFLFLLIIRHGIQTALRAENRLSRALALGITSIFGLQAFCNMGVVTGLLPTKGFPLPLVSFGGSSLLVTLFMLGVLSRLAENR